MQFRQTKVLLKKEFPAGESPISEHSCIAIKKSTNTKNEEVYFAISNDKGGFMVWHMTLDAKGETVQSGPTPILQVEIAHNNCLVSLMQFVQIKGEIYLATGAGLDQRVNIWRI